MRFRTFLTAALDGGERWLQALDALTPREELWYTLDRRLSESWSLRGLRCSEENLALRRIEPR